MKNRDFFLPVLIFPCFWPLLRKFIENKKKYESLTGRESRQRVCVFGELGVSPECSGGLLYDSRTCNNGPCRKFFLLQKFSNINKFVNGETIIFQRLQNYGETGPRVQPLAAQLRKVGVEPAVCQPIKLALTTYMKQNRAQSFNAVSRIIKRLESEKKTQKFSLSVELVKLEHLFARLRRAQWADNS